MYEDLISKIPKAQDRIQHSVLKTPCIESKELGNLIQGRVYLKLESEQYTGSFKARGALNKVLSLSSNERSKGMITASTGNHAQGFARAMQLTEHHGTIYMPENASSAKIKALKQYPVDLIFYGQDSLTTELQAKKKATESNAIWISPYNDLEVIAGQGTIGLEIANQVESLDSILITVGGGGLISGVGSYLKQHWPSIRIIGCLPENSPEMALSLESGKIVYLDEIKETLSDGSAGGLEEGSITFPICQAIVDECILVSEEEIKSGIRWMAHKYKKVVEGSAGVALGALLKNPEQLQGQRVGIVICGGNIELGKWCKIVRE